MFGSLGTFFLLTDFYFALFLKSLYIMLKWLLSLWIIQLWAFGTVCAQQVRESILLNNGWKFAYGHAGDMKKDFTHGTEYFTYLAKAKAFNQNQGPSSVHFDDSLWQTVSLPHDWVVDLPFQRMQAIAMGIKLSDGNIRKQV